MKKKKIKNKIIKLMLEMYAMDNESIFDLDTDDYNNKSKKIDKLIQKLLKK